MNVDRLLAHYERIADAPDAVPRLRRFILDLAVRGKLVAQDPNDEPAAELLKQIAAEKTRLVRAGKIKKQSTLPPVGPYEAPFSVSNTWEWTRIGSTAYIEMGQSPPSEHYNRTGQGIPFFQGKADFGKRYPTARYWCTEPKKYAAHGDILISVRAPVGPTNVASESCCIGRGLAALRSHNGIDRHYLLRCLEAFEHELAALGFGTTFVAINKNQLTGFVIPLPPLAEQHRIVAKVDELMALCDRLEVARIEREATRDRLSASSLVRLDAPDPDPMVFRNHAAFALEHLTPLTTRRDQIKALRQTILNLAVRGKLVEQDPNDEPASELLDKIKAKRKKLYAAKLIPKPKTLPLLEDIAHLFLLPEGWMLSMLGELCYQVADGPHFSPQYVPASEGVPFLSTRNVRSDGFDLDSVKYVSRKDHEKFCNRIRPERDDIIYTKGGTTGIAKLNDLDMEFSVWVHLAVLRIDKEWLLPRYLEMALNSPHCYEQSQQYTQGISNFDLGLTRMIKITVPLPPLAEQHRIVARVDELMALCDQLETSLTTGDDTRFRLLGALLTEALEPGESHASAQAERVVAHGRC